MISINIRSNFPQVMESFRTAGEAATEKALTRALNTVVTQGRTAMAREISRKYRISVGTAKARLSIERAKRTGGALRFEAKLEATRRGQGRSMNLIAFVEQSVTLAQARKRMKAGEGGTHTLRQGGQVQKALELRFQIKRTGGKKMLPGAFIANKGRTVFIREGKSRLPIKALNTLDVTQMFNTKAVAFVVRDEMIARFPASFARELRAVMGGFVR